MGGNNAHPDDAHSHDGREVGPQCGGIPLFLLFRFSKPSFVLIGLAILVTGGISVWLYLDNQAHLREKAAVELEVRHDTERCSPEYPLLVHIRNGAKRAIMNLTFSLRGYRQGHSNAIYSSSTYRTDRIMPPGSGHSACWTVPAAEYGVSDAVLSAHPPAQVDWRGTPSYIGFED